MHDPKPPSNPVPTAADSSDSQLYLLAASERQRQMTRAEWFGALTLVSVVFSWQGATAWPWSFRAMIDVAISTAIYTVPILLLYLMWRHDAVLTRREAARRADPTAFRAHFEPEFCLRCGESLQNEPRQGDCPACGTRFQRVLVSGR